MLEEVIARGPFREFGVLGHRCTIEFIRAELADKKFNRDYDQIVFWIKFSPEVCSVISTAVALPVRDYTIDTLLPLLKASIEDCMKRIEKEYEIKLAQEEVQDSKREKTNILINRIATMLYPSI
jgi:hypothetical protein